MWWLHLDESVLLGDLRFDLPHLKHFCTDFPTIIFEFVKNARHLETFCFALYETVGPMNIDFIKTLVAVRIARFEKDSDRIFVLNLIFYPPEDQTGHPNVSTFYYWFVAYVLIAVTNGTISSMYFVFFQISNRLNWMQRWPCMWLFHFSRARPKNISTRN